MSDEHLFTSSGLLCQENTFCLDTGGRGAIPLRFRWSGVGVDKPLRAHEWAHVCGSAWFGLEVEAEPRRN